MGIARGQDTLEAEVEAVAVQALVTRTDDSLQYCQNASAGELDSSILLT